MNKGDLLEKKHIAILFIACLVSTTPYFFRYEFFGGDSYFYLNYVCHHTGWDLGNKSKLEKSIMDFVPCNIFYIKLMQMFLLFATVIIIGFIGELFFDKLGWLAGLFSAGFSPALLQIILKFENDMFAMPLLALSFYFYFYSTKHTWFSKKWIMGTVLCILFLFLSSLLFKLTTYSLFIFAAENIVFLLISFTAIILMPESLTMLSPNFGVDELMPIIGIISIGFLIFGAIKLFKKKETSISTLLLVLQGRFYIFVPFLWSLSVVNLIQFVESKSKYKNVFKNIMIVWCFIGLLGLGYITTFYAPSPDDIILAELSAHKALDTNTILLNDWGLGWVIINSGYDTNYKAMYPQPDYNNFVAPAYLFKNKLIDTNRKCDLIGESTNFNLLYCKQ